MLFFSEDCDSFCIYYYLHRDGLNHAKHFFIFFQILKVSFFDFIGSISQSRHNNNGFLSIEIPQTIFFQGKATLAHENILKLQNKVCAANSKWAQNLTRPTIFECITTYVSAYVFAYFRKEIKISIAPNEMK